MKEITLLANAKLNLYLDITGKRDDGYHLLETVMQSVDLCDIITIKLGGNGISVTCSNPEIPCGEKNICYTAASCFGSAVGEDINVEIKIEKRIPHGAGMGGGSADAAAVLTGLNLLFGEVLEREVLMKLAAEVGADVPFCMEGGLKLCKGIGDGLYYAEPLPERVYLAVMPDFRCGTREAYLRWDQDPVKPHGKAAEFTKAGEKFPEKMYNVFAQLYNDARIFNIIEKLLSLGADGAELTGSGAAIFGVFKDEETASQAAREFSSYFTAVCKPAKSGIIIIESRDRIVL